MREFARTMQYPTRFYNPGRGRTESLYLEPFNFLKRVAGFFPEPATPKEEALSRID